MRIDGEGLVYLDEGETIPASCTNCGYLWQPKEKDPKTVTCPLCGTVHQVDDLPTFSPVDP